MSLSLVAVFIPLLLMGDLVGRLFREFALTLSVAVLISMVVSLTLTPMMCARLLRPRPGGRRRGAGARRASVARSAPAAGCCAATRAASRGRCGIRC